jgi:hypothetical protein
MQRPDGPSVPPFERADASWVQADFNGFLGNNLLCLAHCDTVVDLSGQIIELRSGLKITVFDDDIDDAGRPDRLVATGVVERSPDSAQCRGSRWALRLAPPGVRHESELAGT